ncbi:hypothetical protein [Vibrio gallaecicus]|uniref:hypothetical protein n=1 Tax=Vibrio gallaecicus TaxID=552386 RepID=UPI0025B29FE3|nr:hypothetical protein [Vibrio gallaecicus]MDN3616413.1 hypothetical protein [Vibrio gallaecicus]
MVVGCWLLVIDCWLLFIGSQINLITTNRFAAKVIELKKSSMTTITLVIRSALYSINGSKDPGILP